MLICNFCVDTGFLASGARINKLFLNVMPFTLIGSSRSVEGDYCLHLRG